MDEIKIPCLLTITPGGPTIQNRLRLAVDGEAVFDGFEHELTIGHRKMAGEIISAGAEAMAKLGQDMQGTGETL